MLIRYFGAARAATGVDEENLQFQDGDTVQAVLRRLEERHPNPAGDGPALAGVISRSSFLCNEVAVRDEQQPLAATDTLDILPPFAGG